jgi:hypothetical protein
MKINKNDHVGRAPIDVKNIRSEIIRVRFTPEERLLIEGDCKNTSYYYISTYLRDYYLKARDGGTIVIRNNLKSDLDSLEDIINARSKINSAISLLKRHVNADQPITLEQIQEIYQLLDDTSTSLHHIKTRIEG